MASFRPILISISRILLLILIIFSDIIPNPTFSVSGISSDEAFSNKKYSILKADNRIYGQHYAPPFPPPPPPSLPHPTESSCEDDLGGVGSFDALCLLRSSIKLTDDLYVKGNGSIEVLDGVHLTCPVAGCTIAFNLSGIIRLRNDSLIVAGTVYLEAFNVSIAETAVVNASALGGDPPTRTTGVPRGFHGDGGGYGGRGASCYKMKDRNLEDEWGGDAYGWTWLMYPDSYGSSGGTTNEVGDYGGGGGGGRLRVLVVDMLELRGSIFVDGGDAGLDGGGGSGGSIFLTANKMKGNGKISASGGSGVAGGGGGRIAINVFSRHDEQKIFVHGGRSLSCPYNNGAAGTLYDTIPKSLTVNNYNLLTNTDTLLMEFPYKPLWINVFVKNNAKVNVPLLWSRVQVQGLLSITGDSIFSFGLIDHPYSEFELIAEELLVSDSKIKVFGALRMSIKMLLMWNSKMLIDSDADAIVATSLLETSNLIVLKGGSLIHSNSNLGIHGQGVLNLSGPGDVIEAQRLILSLFYSVQVGPGSILRAPLENTTGDDMVPRLNCDTLVCPMELLHPPEDCNVNSSLSFTLQICRVEDISVEGTIQGNVIHFHRARSVVVQTTGAVTASGLGCKGGIGQGMVSGNDLGGGGGYGGTGGIGSYNGTFVKGGISYGNDYLPCLPGSGSGNESFGFSTAGGGIIVMGSMEHSLASLSVYGSIETDGESYQKSPRILDNVAVNGSRGTGGGSGGSILLFLQTVLLDSNSIISSIGGYGFPNGGGGGGGGRIHFDWSYISTGDEYLPIANVKGNISISGGPGHNHGFPGKTGSITGKACPKGLFGVFCKECPLGTFKNVSGSDETLCQPCPPYERPQRAIYISVRGGVAETPCPYECISTRYHMPHCYTTLEEVMYTFGGPWLSGLLLFGILFLAACVFSLARMKFIGTDELPYPAPTHGYQIDHSFPYLESLNEVNETIRVEESRNHVHRLYFLGPNTFREPWHLLSSPPDQIKEIVYEDAFVTFVDEVNALASYQWWEEIIYSISSVLAYPVAWLWQNCRRKKKLQLLRDFVRFEYDHSCLRSCRSRALYEGLKLAANPDLTLAYVDFFLGDDEKIPNLPPQLQQRFPIYLIFGGYGSYMDPFTLHSDNFLTSLISEAVPPCKWFRLVAGLNAQLRLVRRGYLRETFLPVISWLRSHTNPFLSMHGIVINLAWFQASKLGYCQFGLVLTAAECEPLPRRVNGFDQTSKIEESSSIQTECASSLLGTNETANLDKNMIGGIINSLNVCIFKDPRDIFYPFSLIVHNTKPVGHQDFVGLVISIILLADFSLVMLVFLQLYSFSWVDVFLVLYVLPFGLLLPFPAGINALFSHGPRKSAALSHIYSLWNISSLVNVVVAFICGFVHYKTQTSSNKKPFSIQPWNWGIDENGWWMFPCALVLCKCFQARLIDWHIANLEIQDRSLYSKDPEVFWRS